MILLSKEQPSEREEKVKEFMEKLRNCIDLKKIFDKYSMICIFCLENFKSDTDTDIEELKKDEKKKNMKKKKYPNLIVVINSIKMYPFMEKEKWKMLIMPNEIRYKRR